MCEIEPGMGWAEVHVNANRDAKEANSPERWTFHKENYLRLTAKKPGRAVRTWDDREREKEIDLGTCGWVSRRRYGTEDWCTESNGGENIRWDAEKGEGKEDDEYTFVCTKINMPAIDERCARCKNSLGSDGDDL